MGRDPGKSLIRRAIECPAHDGLGSARSARAGSARRGGTPAEQPENRGPAARHRGQASCTLGSALVYLQQVLVERLGVLPCVRTLLASLLGHLPRGFDVLLDVGFQCVLVDGRAAVRLKGLAELCGPFTVVLLQGLRSLFKRGQKPLFRRNSTRNSMCASD